MSTKTKRPNYAIIEYDENGNAVMFKIHQAALHYEVKYHPLSNDMRVDEMNYDNVMCKARDLADGVIEQTLFSPEDKMDFITEFKKSNKLP